MLVTIVLSLVMMAALFLMLYAAVALVQEDASIQVLYDMFKDWQNNPAKWQKYGENLKQYARPNAAMDMARLVAGVLPAELRQELRSEG